MDKIILDITDKLFDGDMLIYKGGKLSPVSAGQLTEELYKKIALLEKRVSALETKINAQKSVIDLLIKGEN